MQKGGNYSELCREHGYGTLIVAVPLWFAMTTPPTLKILDQRIMEFANLVIRYLQHYTCRLEKEDCPFRSVIVVWTPSLQSVYHWKSLKRHGIYRDFVYEMVAIVNKMKVTSGHPRDIKLTLRIDSISKSHFDL